MVRMNTTVRLPSNVLLLLVYYISIFLTSTSQSETISPSPSSSSSPSFLPTNINGCRLWYDASDLSTYAPNASNILTTWMNKIDRLNATGTAITNENFINGLPTIRFNLTNTLRTANFVCTTGNRALFAAIKLGTPGVADIIMNTDGFVAPQCYTWVGKSLQYNQRGNLYMVLSSPQNLFNSESVLSITMTTNDAGIFINGNRQLSTSSTFTFSTGTTNVWFGGIIAGVSGQIDIGELLLYDGMPTVTERQQIERYLGDKWGLSNKFPTPSPTRTPSVTPSNTPSRSFSSSTTSSLTSTPTPSLTPSVTPSISPSPSPTPSTSVSNSPTPSTSVSNSPTPSITVSNTPTPSTSVSNSPTSTMTRTSSSIGTDSPSLTASNTPTSTSSESLTSTSSFTGTESNTASVTSTSSASSTGSTKIESSSSNSSNSTLSSTNLNSSTASSTSSSATSSPVTSTETNSTETKTSLVTSTVSSSTSPLSIPSNIHSSTPSVSSLPATIPFVNIQFTLSNVNVSSFVQNGGLLLLAQALRQAMGPHNDTNITVSILAICYHSNTSLPFSIICEYDIRNSSKVRKLRISEPRREEIHENRDGVYLGRTITDGSIPTVDTVPPIKDTVYIRNRLPLDPIIPSPWSTPPLLKVVPYPHRQLQSASSTASTLTTVIAQIEFVPSGSTTLANSTINTLSMTNLTQYIQQIDPLMFASVEAGNIVVTDSNLESLSISTGGTDGGQNTVATLIDSTVIALAVTGIVIVIAIMLLYRYILRKQSVKRHGLTKVMNSEALPTTVIHRDEGNNTSTVDTSGTTTTIITTVDTLGNHIQQVMNNSIRGNNLDGIVKNNNTTTTSNNNNNNNNNNTMIIAPVVFNGPPPYTPLHYPSPVPFVASTGDTINGIKSTNSTDTLTNESSSSRWAVNRTLSTTTTVCIHCHGMIPINTMYCSTCCLPQTPIIIASPQPYPSVNQEQSSSPLQNYSKEPSLHPLPIPKPKLPSLAPLSPIQQTNSVRLPNIRKNNNKVVPVSSN